VRPSLTIGYSSLGARVAHARLPTPDEDAEILLCVQGEVPEGYRTPPGARLVRVPGRGVARSRNAAIDAARGRYLLFCDDDVRVDVAGARTVIAELDRRGAALALGRGMGEDGALRKAYPPDVRRLTLFNSAKAATYEMLVDVDQVRSAGVRFDERFGAGAELYLGDEYIFIADCLRAGLRGYAIPSVLGVHPVESSGSRWGGRDAHVRAVALNRVFGRAALPARTAFAVRARRRLGGWGGVRRFALDGTPPPAMPDDAPPH
jgi:hypothetical protein